jgi:tetratricopeptide (TPR) repeat protein
MIQAHHFTEAVKAFEQATKVDPKHPVLWNNLGTAYLDIDKRSNAESAFKKAIELDPNYALAHYNLGAVRDAALDYDAAVASYARAIELDRKLLDPAVNPAIVNNQHLAAIQLVLYGRQAGARGGKVTTVDDPGTKPKKSKSSAPTNPMPQPPPSSAPRRVDRIGRARRAALRARAPARTVGPAGIDLPSTGPLESAHALGSLVRRGGALPGRDGVLSLLRGGGPRQDRRGRAAARSPRARNGS